MLVTTALSLLSFSHEKGSIEFNDVVTFHNISQCTF